MEKNKISAEYLCKLQAVYRYIERKGILVDHLRLASARRQVNQMIETELKNVSTAWNCHVYVGSTNDNGSDTSVNLNSSSGKRTPLLKLQDLGYKIPKISSKDEDGNYISKESLNELALQKMLAENQFGHPTGDPVLKSLLLIRELTTLKQRYINANLYEKNGYSLFLSSYNVAGTTSGRRSSKKHIFGYGNNAQNFPKHGELAFLYRQCLVSRPSYIFLAVDQIQAEDWPVSALAQNIQSLDELQNNVDRHRKLACAIFNLAWDHFTDKEWKDSIQRYLGKKTRHANNYGMQAQTMSDSLAKEGKSFSVAVCDSILKRVNQIDPSVQGVFHKYVKDCLHRDRTLRTPWGRERQFFGLRTGDNSGNNKIYREAFSYIPQSTVADNTGFAIYDLGYSSSDDGIREDFSVVQEGHDSIIQEVEDKPEVIWDYIQRTIKAFDRVIKFDNGIELQIPVEGELGYNLSEMTTLSNKATKSKRLTDLSYQDFKDAYDKVREAQEKELEKEALKDAATENQEQLDISVF